MKTSRFIFLLFSATTAADNSRTYNEACQIGSSQCTVSQGLFCSNGFCSCSSSYSWNSINNTCKLIWIVFNEIIWQGINQVQLFSIILYPMVQHVRMDRLSVIHPLDWRARVVVHAQTTKYGIYPVVFVQWEHFWIHQIFVVRSILHEIFISTFSTSTETAKSLNGSCTVGSNQCDSTKDLICNNSICQCDYSTKYWNINFQQCSKFSSFFSSILFFCLNRISSATLELYSSMCLW